MKFHSVIQCSNWTLLLLCVLPGCSCDNQREDGGWRWRRVGHHQGGKGIRCQLQLSQGGEKTDAGGRACCMCLLVSFLCYPCPLLWHQSANTKGLILLPIQESGGCRKGKARCVFLLIGGGYSIWSRKHWDKTPYFKGQPDDSGLPGNGLKNDVFVCICPCSDSGAMV